MIWVKKIDWNEVLDNLFVVNLYIVWDNSYITQSENMTQVLKSQTENHMSHRSTLKSTNICVFNYHIDDQDMAKITALKHL